MSLAEILTALGFVITIPASIAALVQVGTSRRDALLKQGRHEQEEIRMEADIERLFEKARIQEACTAESNTAIAEMRNDIKWIRDSLKEIKTLIAERKKE